MRSEIFICFFVALFGIWSELSADSVFTQEFSVEPLTRYRLTFSAENEHAEKQWEVRIKTTEGFLPYEGVFAENWQMLKKGTHPYQHEFLTPRESAKLELRVDATQVTNIQIEKIQEPNLVINGDFSAGADNYSGWNTLYLARLKQNDIGQLEMVCEREGYVISDFIPVKPGATYRFQKETSPGGRVLGYDRGYLNTGILFDVGFVLTRNGEFEVPEGCVFIRIEYCDRRENKTPVIQKIGIELVQEEGESSMEKLPAYPGEIILQPNAALPEIRAARELQHWIRRISGKEIRVLAQTSGMNYTRIFVGRTWAEEHFPEDLKTLSGSDGLAIRKLKEDIYVFGARPAGTLFGAIRLLEDNSDLIFARPNHGEIFSKNPDLRFENADCLLLPAFVYRMSNPYTTEDFDNGIWQGRVGLNTSTRLYNGFRRREMGEAPSFSDNFMSVIARRPEFSFDKASKKHPEFFALVNGTRRILPKGYICYTAPGIAEAIANGLRDVVKSYEARNETLEFLQVRTRDGWLVCACEKCMEPIVLGDGSKLEPRSVLSLRDPLFFSTRMADLLNRVSEDFARTYPDITLTTLSYLYASTPPAIPGNSFWSPMFCAYPLSSIRFPILDGENNHFADGEKWEEKFREYLKRTTNGKKISMFSYHYTNGFSAVADSAREDWLEMTKTGGAFQIHLDGFSRDDAMEEKSINAWDYDAAEKWIMSRLMWDPTLDAQKLREEYCKRAYQEAAPEMMEFYSLIRNAWKNPEIKFGVNCHTSAASLFETFIVKTELEEKLHSLLEQAESKVKNSDSRFLITRVKNAFDHLGDSLQRIYIPHIPESTEEWNLPESTFWLQAQKFKGFKQVSTWEDVEGKASRHLTTVSVMRDNAYFYVRFDAENAGDEDRIEILLEAVRHSTKYYLATDKKGERFSSRDFLNWASAEWDCKIEPTEHGYIAMFRIPFTLIKNLDSTQSEFQFTAKFSRIISGPHGEEESSLTGYSITRTHFPNHWTTLSVRRGE